MKDASGAVIYVGKAVSLRARLMQYFNAQTGAKTASLVSQVDSIEFVVTKDGNEALILESNLIKSHQPKYNLLLKDAKHYSCLAITDETYPRLLVVRKNSKNEFKTRAKRVYGPFAEEAKRSLGANFLRKVLQIRTCKKLPKKPCLQYHLGNCRAPCIKNVTPEQYAFNVATLEKILSGKHEGRSVIGSLKREMGCASDSQDYETAKTLLTQINALKIFFNKQRIEQRQQNDEDYLFFQRVDPNLFVQILKSRAGILQNTEKHDLEIRTQEEPETQFCIQYYQNNPLPSKVYSNLGFEQMALLNSALKTVAFQKPSGKKNEVLKIAKQTLQCEKISPSVLLLQKSLRLPLPPLIIETFDVSSLFGENPVGSMVRFQNGKPDKAGYRKYLIKQVTGQDDYAMLEEIIRRRYSRLAQESRQMPDLILVDGGLGQLHFAQKALNKLGLEIPLASIAKQEEEIFLPERKNPFKLPKTNDGLKLLQHCRDEAHRFAITFHKTRRKKQLLNPE